MQDLSEHPFSHENIARESGDGDRVIQSWESYVDQLERLLGHSVDGNDVDREGCGYSMDEAYDWFRNGYQPMSGYAVIVNRPRYDNGAAVSGKAGA